MNENYIKNYYNIFPRVNPNYQSGPENEIWTQTQTDKYFSRIAKILPNRENINVEQREILQSMQNAINEIGLVFAPLDYYGIEYELTIGGGALRDMVLNKTSCIGDFDIIFYVNTDSNNVNKLEKISKEYGMSCIDISQNGDMYINQKKLTKFLVSFVEKKYQYCNTFLDKDSIEQVYLTNYINGIVKINSNDKLSKPIDLIFSKHDGHIFIHNFNFDICKIFINFSHKEIIHLRNDLLINSYHFHKNNDDSILSLLDKIMVTHSFVHDIENKTFSLNLAKFNKEHVSYFMNKHYLKLQERYPDYKKNFYISDKYKQIESNSSQLEKKLYEKEIIELHYKLANDLEDKAIQNKVKKL